MAQKNGHYLSCNLHKMGATLNNEIAVAPFSCKKVWSWVGGWLGGWVGGWVDGRVGGWVDGW